MQLINAHFAVQILAYLSAAGLAAYVVGLSDYERGQLVVAAIVPREGEQLDLGDVNQQLRQRLSSYKVPREYVIISREEVTMLPTNKVSKRKMVELVAEKLGRDL